MLPGINKRFLVQYSIQGSNLSRKTRCPIVLCLCQVGAVGRGKHLVIMQRFRSLSGGYAGNSSKTVIIAILVCSLFLHFDAVKSRKTPEMEPSFISTRELDLLTDKAGYRSNISRILDQVPVKRLKLNNIQQIVNYMARPWSSLS